MSRLARRLVDVAVTICAPDQRPARREEWQSDLLDAESIGVSPQSVVVGAFSTAAVTRIAPLAGVLRGERTLSIAQRLGLGTAMSAIALIAGGTAVSLASNSPVLFRPTSTFVSYGDQAVAAAEIADFVRRTSPPDPSAMDRESYTVALHRYWLSVPWDSVYAQWDCILIDPPHVTSSPDVGAALQLEESHMCGDNGLSSVRAGVVAPRSALLTTKP